MQFLKEEFHSDKAYGMTAFEYHGTDPRFNKVFKRGMADHSSITMKKLLETYKGFEGLTSVVDVGGGTGAVVNMIVSKYSSIKGIDFDLPHVIEDAPQFLGMFFILIVLVVQLLKSIHLYLDLSQVQFLLN